jgi:phthalate 3,4-dioxygenase ferredoxin reductase subunit
MTQTVVIVGSGIGGIRTAQALRSVGYSGQLTVVGQEAELPYDRPPLSKDFLAGRREAEAVWLLSQQEAAESGISLRLGVTAEHIVPEGKCLVLGNGETLPYDVCVVATGASARLPSAWSKLDGVHVLRSMADSQALREQLLQRREVAVIGGGFIGSEVAATARSIGLRVTVIDPLPLPLERTLGAKAAQLVTDLHQRNGVTTVFGAGVDSIDSSDAQLDLRLSTGATLTADAVVLGIGAVPNDGWLSDSGLPVSGGLVCDEYCRVAGRDDIFAVGDVARWYSPRRGGHVRVEHWTNAVEQARCVAHNIAFPDQLAAHDGIEYVWTDQYDWKIQVAGRPSHDGVAAEAAVGDFAGPRPHGAVLYGDGNGALCGAVAVNWPRAIALCRRALSVHTRYQEALQAVTGTRR